MPDVYLCSGVSFKNDPDYGKLVRIEQMPDLFLAIAFAVATKREPLTGGEWLFLRKRMDMRQIDLADELRVSENTIANYERRGAEGPADLAVRWLFFAHVAEDEERADELREQARELMLPKRRREIGGRVGAWHEAGTS